MKQENQQTVFKLSSQQAIRKNLNTNDLTQLFARKLFKLPDNASFIEFPCEDDPRGYVELYGSDPDEIHKLENGEHVILYNQLACFFDHLSFIVPSTGAECIVLPEEEGIHIHILDSITNEPIAETTLDSSSKFISYLDEKLFRI